MTPSIAQTVVAVFTASNLKTAFMFQVQQAQELALAVNLQRKYAVQFEVSQHGIFCDSWLAHRNAQHESHRQLACFYTQPSGPTQLSAIVEHLTALLQESAQ
ncbi:hypothetical protein VE30_02165 [Vreelandella aquamarina]|uniref:hypothetical protein n=1 Tax=Vreelandella TaxID=3137766 RepID=UPI0005CC5780|nr:hypothetical protein [Halomonas meridiana]KJD20542.1 hypothetical protein VE30_02165 [Halomonas meridiana]